MSSGGVPVIRRLTPNSVGHGSDNYSHYKRKMTKKKEKKKKKKAGGRGGGKTLSGEITSRGREYRILIAITTAHISNYSDLLMTSNFPPESVRVV